MKEKMSGLVLAPYERVKIELSGRSWEDYPHNARPQLGGTKNTHRDYLVSSYFDIFFELHWGCEKPVSKLETVLGHPEGRNSASKLFRYEIKFPSFIHILKY